MPEIQYPTNPNSDTAFVVQGDGTKNRALMTAPQDTSTLELPSNPNSTKGYVTIGGKKHRVVLTANIAGGGGGGGAVDSVNGKTGAVVLTAKDVAALPQYSEMPEASSSTLGEIVQYVGPTNINYTNGFPYKNVRKSIHYGAVEFNEPSILSFSGNFGEFLAYSGLPSYWEIDTCEFFYEGDHRWFLMFGDYFQPYYTDELIASGFTVNEPQTTQGINGTITWTYPSVNTWVQIEMQGAVPQYAKLPAPGANNVGFTAMYVGTEDFETPLGMIKPGKFYKVSPFYYSDPQVSTTGDVVVGAFETNSFMARFDMSEQGSVTFVAVEDGGTITWELDGEEVDLAYYGFVEITGTIVAGDEITVSWTPQLEFFTWVPATIAVTPYDVPVLTAADWHSDSKVQTVYSGPFSQDSTIIVGPAPQSVDDYVAAGIVCIKNDYESLTFTCKTIPTNDIELSIAII